MECAIGNKLRFSRHHDDAPHLFCVQVDNSASGILGETFEPTLDSDGNPIMSGMEAIRGKEADCE